MLYFSLFLNCWYRLWLVYFYVVEVIPEVEIKAAWQVGSEGRIDGVFQDVIQQDTDLDGIVLGPVPILPLPLDLSPNPRFCVFPRRGRVSQYLMEQGGVLFFPLNSTLER